MTYIEGDVLFPIELTLPLVDTANQTNRSGAGLIFRSGALVCYADGKSIFVLESHEAA